MFYDPQIRPWVLWEGTHYRVIADAFPRLPGHILLITRDHVLHHADACDAWWPEFEAATGRMREFLLATCGAASFWENGFIGMEVPHAHLRGLPVHLTIPAGGEAKLRSVNGWADVRRHRDRDDGYTFLSGSDGRYVALDRAFWLAAVRQATIARTGGTLDPATGGLRRGGIEEVEETRRLWALWASSAFPGI